MNCSSFPYLTFALGEEKFAISVDHVQEIVEFGQVTKVPNAPNYMLGIINLRGRVLPLLDTKLKLGLSDTALTSKSRIMVLELPTEKDKHMQIGALVDVAREVVDIAESEIQAAPDVDNLKHSSPITGIVNNQGNITMLMDIAKVFSLKDVSEINKSWN